MLTDLGAALLMRQVSPKEGLEPLIIALSLILGVKVTLLDLDLAPGLSRLSSPSA